MENADKIYRQPIITVLGHVDSGKCVSSSTLIHTSNGLIEASELYDKFNDGEPLNDENLRRMFIYSLNLNNLKIECNKLIACCKLNTTKLVRLKLENGDTLEVTPEHSFLTYIGRGVFEFKNAYRLDQGDSIVGISTGTGYEFKVPCIYFDKRKNAINIRDIPSCEYYLELYRVVSKSSQFGNFQVFDFQVSRNKNFIANNVIIHNTTLLDKIRGTAVQLKEAGGITQHIGASLLPKETIEAIAGDLLRKFKFKLKVPGLLIIDTPGHEVFTNLRRRGGSASDIAILVVDVNKGFEPQTHESIQILISRRVPFLVAANKVDLIHGWRKCNTLSILESLKKQDNEVMYRLDEKISYIITALNTYRFNADRFDRIRDFRRTVAIVPVSAKTGEGIKELLAVLVGLVQRFMLDRLEVNLRKPGTGVILEVSREHGLGTVLKAIHIDGIVKVGDYIVTAGSEGVVVRKIRSILMPAPLDEIRAPRYKFKNIEVSKPAAGVIIVAPDVDSVYAGAPFYSVHDEANINEYASKVMEEVSSIKVDTDRIGVVIKADTLGSLEALINYARRKGITIRKADVGYISKRDVVDASVVKRVDEDKGVILAFNVDILSDAEELAKTYGIPIFKGNILYRIVDEYLAWVSERNIRKRMEEFKSLVKPGKILILKGFVFRRSKPAIVGIRVLSGMIMQKWNLMNSKGKRIGQIHQIQDRGKSIPEAKRDMEVAISIREAIVGKTINEGDILYVDIPEHHARKLLKEYIDMLSDDEREVLKEIIEIKRKNNPLWAR